MPLFLIWYADLDAPSEKRKSGLAETTIPPRLIANLTRAMDSLYALDKRLKDEIDKRREDDDKLTERVHNVEKSQERIKVTLAIVLTLLGSLVLFAFREPLSALVRPSIEGPSARPTITAPPAANLPAGTPPPP